MRSKKALFNIISSLIVQIVTIISGLIIPRMIISNYGSEVNGAVTSITHFLGFITLIEAGFGPVIMSSLFKPIANNDQKSIENILKASEKIFRRISYIFIIYTIILCVVLPITFESEFDMIFTISLVVIICLATFVEYYFGMTYSLYLLAKQERYVISVIQILAIVLNTIVVVGLIHLKVNIQIVKLASAAIFILKPIIQRIYVKKKYNLSLKNVKDDYQLKQKWDGLAQHIAFVIHNNTDIVILTLCANIKEVSVYSIYAMITNAVKNILQSVTKGVEATWGDMIAKEEHDKLRKNFTIYEDIYITIAAILFYSMLFLIIPFVKVYTEGITDANYVRPIFAYIYVIAEFLFVLRMPYNDLIKMAGHFRQTRNGAIIEAIVNIIISIILIWRLGIIGVAIGTLCAMAIRTIQLVYYASKNILRRNVWHAFEKILVTAFEGVALSIIINMLPSIEIADYKTWLVNALIIFATCTAPVITINSILYRKDLKGGT